MFIDDVVKINLVREGYLPNYPPHLISKEEMCDAFLSDNNDCYFDYYYPLIDSSLESQYTDLRDSILYHLTEYKDNDLYILPDWIYSYALGSVISVYSSDYEKHDLLVMLNLDNLSDIFTPEAARSCYDISKIWLSKLPDSEEDHRTPTIFGAPHVVKYLRLRQVSVNS